MAASFICHPRPKDRQHLRSPVYRPGLKRVRIIAISISTAGCLMAVTSALSNRNYFKVVLPGIFFRNLFQACKDFTGEKVNIHVELKNRTREFYPLCRKASIAGRFLLR